MTQPNDATIRTAEGQLSDRDPAVRRRALETLAAAARAGALAPDPEAKPGWVNLHCHTFFSYNPYGWSPSQFAWLASRRGLGAAGIVDFDVLDGIDEFLEAGALLGLRTTAGLECRVFVPEFSTREINSPGEPGIAYHMGVGFPRSAVAPDLRPFLERLRAISTGRNRRLLAAVNGALAPAALDYERDVLPLTPKGNATERHICQAYAARAQAVFPEPGALAAFWTERLKTDAARLDLPAGPKLQNAIRSATMKRGGVGYVAPDSGSFPTLAETNAFILAAGAVPAMTWLDGLSAGEQAIEEWLDVSQAGGAAAVNIIPDRNYTPGTRDRKLENLYDVVERANRRNLFVIAGTEMNSPGNKFVDRFDTLELKPLLPVFVRGANIAYGHTMLQRRCAMGYTSDWARRELPDAATRNNFYETMGIVLDPFRPEVLDGLEIGTTAGEALDRVLHVLRHCRGS